MKGMSPTQARRIRDLEAEEPPREPRTRFFFRDYHQTDADIRAEIDAAKQSGWVKPGDRCVVFRWQSPDEPPPQPSSA